MTRIPNCPSRAAGLIVQTAIDNPGFQFLLDFGVAMYVISAQESLHARTLIDELHQRFGALHDFLAVVERHHAAKSDSGALVDPVEHQVHQWAADVSERQIDAIR